MPRIRSVSFVALLATIPTISACQDRPAAQSTKTATAAPRITAASCPAANAGTYAASAHLVPVVATATTATVTVCVSAAKNQPAFASFQGALRFDTAAATFDTLVQHGSGARTVNTNAPGLVRFAGASPTGLTNGALMTVRLKLKRAGRAPSVTLEMPELNSVAGVPVMARLWVQGKAPAKTVATTTAKVPTVKPAAVDTMPRLLSLDREIVRANEISGGNVVMVTIRAVNLDPTSNTLEFGDERISPVRSDSGGRILRFSLPIAQSARGDAPPPMLGPNEYIIRVRTHRGLSNALRIRITP